MVGGKHKCALGEKPTFPPTNPVLFSRMLTVFTCIAHRFSLSLILTDGCLFCSQCCFSLIFTVVVECICQL